MNDKLFRLNRIYAIVDTIVCLAAIACFGLAAFHFGKWWIGLFNLVPLMLYSQHTAMIDADLREARISELAPQDDIECMKEQEEDHGYDRS